MIITLKAETMKKQLLTIAVLMTGLTAFSQTKKVEFGVRSGLNVSTVVGENEDFDTPKGRVSGYIGGLVEFHLTDRFSLQPEVFYSGQGFDLDDDFNEFDAEFQVGYLQFPVLAKFYIIQGLSVQAGPQFGIKLHEEADYDLFDRGGDVETDAFEDFDFQFTGGAAYTFDFGLFVEVRAAFGLTEVIEDSEAHNFVFSTGVGYKF